MDRVLYERFRELCMIEKLRTGEAMESLVRLAVESGGVTRVCTSRTLHDSSGLAVDEALFRSRLARLKATLDYERDLLSKTGEMEDEQESDQLIEKLVELGRRTISKELVKEFETLLTESDKLHQNIRKNMIEENVQTGTSQTQNPTSYAHLHPADH